MNHFWICGELTGDALWLADRDALGSLIGGMIRRHSAEDPSIVEPIAARKALAIAVADELQKRLLVLAMKHGRWKRADASDTEMVVLGHRRGETRGNTLVWMSQVLDLVFVPRTPLEPPPAGRVVNVGWKDDSTLLTSLVEAGFIDGGRL